MSAVLNFQSIKRAGWILLCWLAMQGVNFAAEIKNSACLECHGDKTLTTTNAAGKEISLFVDVAKLAASVHRTNTCASCHSDLTNKHPDDNLAAQPVNCAKCHDKQSRSYDASIHGILKSQGNAAAASCSDCHGEHNVLPPNSPDSPLHFSRLATTCGACHEQAAKDVAESVHGKALAAGHRDAPTCTDCHLEHKIEELKTSSPMKISRDVCGKCHASERMNTKYNLPADRVRTFFESYHGLAAQNGSTLAANCASCHGPHRILPSSDPNSSINRAHLVQTCGKCHTGANENFSFTKVHVDNQSAANVDGVGGRMNWWVRRTYIGLILGVIGAMLLHNGLLMARKLAVIRRTRDRSVVRMNRSQRIQHALLAGSFVALVLTGFALKYPDSWLAVVFGPSEAIRRWIHRIAGILLMGVGAYHMFYVAFTADGRKLVKDFYPQWQDAKDMANNALYLVGLRSEKAMIGRFGYAEKMEYWAVIWGTIIMGVTGLMIWFKIDVTQYLPRWVVELALTIHYYEAILATLAIVVWHFYHVIFDPDVYPLNGACLDGRVSKHWQHEEHPLEKPVVAVDEKVADGKDTKCS